jgi:7,8-dihydropterin-6-yl-methyl-4-(beta-D-ribofuranosyl)aminobenzene 5'-phosphate synthase
MNNLLKGKVLLTTLAENTVNIGGLKGEHGLSFLLRTPGGKLLFDTGQSDLLLHNARHMELALEDLNAVVLSHGHYDHTGGLDAIHNIAPGARIFLHPAAAEAKFTRDADGSSRSIGMKPPALAVIQKARTDAGAITWTSRPTEVMEGVWVTGEIPRKTSFENTGGRFYLDAACARPDPLSDDQALFFDTPSGVVVVLGCAHSGVVNTGEYIRTLTRGRPIRALIGGMHLLAPAPERVEKTLEAFRRWNIQRFTPAHCSGIAAVAKLWAAFPEQCSSCPVGTTLEFDGAADSPSNPK